jgi:hypothetical protein
MGARPVGAPRVRTLLLALVCFDGCLDLRFHGIEVEARALLHRRELDCSHGDLRHLLLGNDEPPELLLEPLEFFQGSRETCALQRIQTQVHENRHVVMNGAAKPAIGLVNEAILVVVDAHSAECGMPDPHSPQQQATGTPFCRGPRRTSASLRHHLLCNLIDHGHAVV